MARPARFRCCSRRSSPGSAIWILPTPTMATDTSSVDSHAAVLEVDLAAIVANWQTLRGRHPSGPVAAVIKADGYGLGANEVAAALYNAGCRHFFVAYLSEAL